jgi:hypothetical protein
MVVERCRPCGFDGTDWSDVEAIALIAELPDRCTGAIDGLADRDLQRRPIPDSWSIAEYVDHVRETTFGMRFILAVALEGPGTDLGEPPASTFDPEPRVVDVPAALAGLRDQAEQLHDQLEQLAAPAWDVTVVIGGETVDVHWIARHAVHDSTHHLTDIARLRGLL